MQAFVVAGIAASVTLLTAYLTQFLADRYRRFAEGSTLAAGIAGDLAARREGDLDYQSFLKELHQQRAKGKRIEVFVRREPKVEEPFYNAIVSKVGLLGPDLAAMVITFYRETDSFARQKNEIDDHHADMSDVELNTRVELMLTSWRDAMKLRDELLPLLKSRAKERFTLFRAY